MIFFENSVVAINFNIVRQMGTVGICPKLAISCCFPSLCNVASIMYLMYLFRLEEKPFV